MLPSALLSEIHPLNNGALDVAGLPPSSSQKVWWKCSLGHEWEVSPKSRVFNKTGCPFCSNRKAWAGFNDLATTHPTLAKQWHPTKNSGLSPTEVLRGSRSLVWWQCSQSHEWKASVVSRAVAKTSCPFCTNRKTDKDNSLPRTHPHLVSEWADDNQISVSEVTYGSDFMAAWQCQQGHTWKAAVRNRTAGKGCPDCASKQYTSKPEKELQAFLSSIHPSVEFNTRRIIHPFELDAWIPEKKIAIEFNGLYWHNEGQKPQSYHYDKWKLCQQKGIQLIQVWEDDWRKRPEAIKSSLSHKLGVSSRERVPARKTVVQELSYSDASFFLEKNHIQGGAKGSTYLGLLHKESVVAVMVAKRTGHPNEIEIVRYATSVTVVGGFTKLLSSLSSRNKEKTIVSFSDHTISDGSLYQKNGFTEDGQVKPDYMYVVQGERKHKFGYRLKRFKSDPSLQWQEGLTEKELAALNKMPRIWDAGKTRWIKLPKNVD